ncbi:hypothetical protein KPL70_014855 [Citrus sinensis]|uniref:Uncharacterized protein n=1 Tax=Citrus sinensis TaxID=2711 RepID=A0ACB8KH84_CITSI|nr:hypothetical protein KPL70_014855 [Citrus sinensis]KAH9753686.1 hypothetical protein KPL71_015165 [Citrus sinensis]
MLRLIKLTLSVTNNFKIYTIPPGQLRHHPPLANNKTLFDIDLLWLLHFQRNIVRGVEGFVAFLCTIFLYSNIVARKLAEDCCKYGAENQSDNSCVARAALQFGTSHDLMENERETLLGILHDQEQSNESSSQHVTFEMDVHASCVYQSTDSNGADLQTHINQNDVYFIAKVIHPFDAQANGELSLSIDDYVVVRQVALMDGRKVNARAKLVGFPRHT